MRQVDLIIIHCSASDLDVHDEIGVIRLWHIQRGFKDIGYHYFLKKNGIVQVGRNEETIGAHAEGHNKNSIGICLSGLNEFTKLQFESLRKLLIDILNRHKLTTLDVLPHKAFNKNKTCPNFDLEKFLTTIYSQEN